MANKMSLGVRVIIYSMIFDVVFFDQLTKIILESSLREPLHLIGNFLTFRLEHNPGIAFSINIPYPLLIVLNLLLFGGIIYFLFRTLDFNRYLPRVIVVLLAGGAIGNLIDRIRLGYVIDFISVGSFPVFNLADSYITIAVFLLLLFYDKIRRPN
jgi:signal peptidase II